ncbi:MAG: hypothetical protein SH868_01055 [Bythopirellula sp.]|nr:hypothetical protein [Bythopirellula sp.]
MAHQPIKRSRIRASVPKPSPNRASAERTFSVEAHDNFFRDVEHAIDARLVQQRLDKLSVNPLLAEAMHDLRDTICTKGQRTLTANAANLTTLYQAVPELFDPFPQAERKLLRARLGFHSKLPSEAAKLAKYFKVSSDEIVVAECNSLAAFLQLLPQTEKLTSTMHSRYVPETSRTTTSGRTMPSKEQRKKSTDAETIEEGGGELSDLKVPTIVRGHHTPSHVDISAATLSREVADYLEWYRIRVEAIVNSPLLVSEQEQLLKILACVPAELSQFLIREFHDAAVDDSPRRQPRLVGILDAKREKNCARTTLHRYVNNGEVGIKLGETHYFLGYELETLKIPQRGRPKNS